MKRKYNFFNYRSISLVFVGLLTGCSSITPAPEQRTETQAHLSTGHDPLQYGPTTPATLVDQKSPHAVAKKIAVTGISYSKEMKDVLFFEERKSQLHVLQRSPNPEPLSVKPSTMSDFQIQPLLSVGPAIIGDQNEANHSPAEKSDNPKAFDLNKTHTNRDDTGRKINYGEIRGLSGAIKGILIQSGYKVVQAKPRVERPDQNDEHFDIIHRIKSGDFDNADYVLYGVLAGLNQSNHTSNISGTSNSMALSRLEIAIDFSLIDTTTHQVIASFVGLGSGEAHRIDGSTVDAQLEYVKLITSAAASLSENVALHLNSQAFVTADVNIGPDGLRQISGTEKFRFDERNFRIYQ